MKHSIETVEEWEIIAETLAESHEHRMKHRHGTIEEWEVIAKQTLANPNASRSECLSALIGITQSKDEWLKEKLAEQMKKAWKADLNVLKKVS